MLFYEASAKIQSCRIVEKYLKNSNGERSIHDQDERIWCDLEDCAIESIRVSMSIRLLYLCVI